MGVVLLVRHGQASFGSHDYDVVLRGDMRRHRETAEGMLEGGGWAADLEVDPGWNEFDHLGVVAALYRAEADRPEADRSDTARSGEGDLPRAHELDRREFQRAFELATRRWTSGEHDAEYPESFRAFTGRVGGALTRACSAAGPGGTVVVVSSGGPIAAACAALVGPGDGEPAVVAGLWARFNTVVVNSSVTRVVVGSTGARMLTYNEHPHLEGETLTYR